MNMKKFGIIIITAVLAFSMLVGCGAQEQAPVSTESPSPVPEVSASPSAAPPQEQGNTPDEKPTPSPSAQATASSAPSTQTPRPVRTQTPSATPNTPAPVSPSASDVIKTMVKAMSADSHNMSEIPSDLYAGVYQIDPSSFEQVVVYGAMMNVKSNEIIVIKAKDTSNLNEAKSALSARLSTLNEQWKNYLPDQYELVKAGTVTTNGLYAALVIAQEAQKAVSAFHSAVR